MTSINADVETPRTGFEPKELTDSAPLFQLPGEVWISVLSTPCGFEPCNFHAVMENLIKNPNITSTSVFRADVFYDSINEASVSEIDADEPFSNFTKHMKPEYRPIKASDPGYERQRTVVRQIVPRNPQLDKPLVQTCHILQSKDAKTQEESVVLMIPHASTPSEIPFHHPTVRALAIRHQWNPTAKHGSLSIHYRLFPETALENRLQRTALNLLKVIHRHGTGQQAGYTKRVDHDAVVPQSKLQNTYTRLKIKYAKTLITDWVEHTDPTKHVFEDLGIAAFLIELWRDIYGITPSEESAEGTKESEKTRRDEHSFPGFVDIGCGNGVLVSVLLQEGYSGWGFDARRRSTWETVPIAVRTKVKELILVPRVLQPLVDGTDLISPEVTAPPFHNGVFPTGTFIISNHADELTPWTPLLAYLSDSPFIAIPCCSHNLAGARCRFNVAPPTTSNAQSTSTTSITTSAGPGPATGSLARPNTTGKQQSAYQGLVAYTAKLAIEMGFAVQKEMLRIPSTRNTAIVGKLRHLGDEGSLECVDQSDKERRVRAVVEREVGLLDAVAKEWVRRAERIAESKGTCH